VSDFSVDAAMSAYSSPRLPIPAVIEISRLDPPFADYYLCLSEFAPGEPLESVSADRWPAIVPAVADALEAMRAISPPANTATLTWPQVLLHRDDGDSRLEGWQQRLEAEPTLFAGYHNSMSRLGGLCALSAVAGVAPTLLHCDLIHRNVHVVGAAITAVFDWGCRRWGDHLYDLAWFDFWAPWHPNLDIGLLRAELANRWGGEPDPDRLAACLLHIGADHLAYNAAVGDLPAARVVFDRLVALDLL